MVQGQERAKLETQVTGTIEVGPDGKVLDYRLEESLSDSVANAVGANIRSWQFEPVLVDDRPVIATTRLRLQLEAEAADDGDYRLRVANVWFGEPERPHAMAAPRYPRDAAAAGVGGKVVMVLRLDEEGNVADVHAEQTSLSIDPGSKRASRFARQLEQASLAAARDWKFRITEMVNGEQIGGSVRVPVTFQMGNGRWASLMEGPRTPAPWVVDQALAGQDDDAVPGEDDLQPLDSRFKLRTQVIGVVL
jgi:TonB family protein